MGYSFAAYLDGISAAPACEADGQADATALEFALIDIAQLSAGQGSLQRWLKPLPHALLYENTFASSALLWSPVLLQLDAYPRERQQQLLGLDAVCRHLPMLAILRSSASLRTLSAHLRECLLIKAETQPYMLRLADTQMLAASARVFSPTQRAAFFHHIDAWWHVDHQGTLENLADPTLLPHASPPDPRPLIFDTTQTHALLEATAVPILASQLRQLDEAFARQLSHAQQTSFASECLTQAGLQALDLDRELIDFALRRWHELAEPAGVRP